MNTYKDRKRFGVGLMKNSSWYKASRLLDEEDIWDRKSRRAINNSKFPENLAYAFQALKRASSGDLLNSRNVDFILRHPEWRFFCDMLACFHKYAPSLVTQTNIEIIRSRQKLGLLAGAIRLLASLGMLEMYFEDIIDHEKPADLAGVLSLLRNPKENGKFTLSAEDREGIKKHSNLRALFDGLKSLKDSQILAETQSAVISSSEDPQCLAGHYLALNEQKKLTSETIEAGMKGIGILEPRKRTFPRHSSLMRFSPKETVFPTLEDDDKNVCRF